MYQFWYLGALIIIYLLLPLFCKLKARRIKIKNHEIPKLYIVWCVLLLTAVAMQICSVILGKSLQKNVILTFRLWSWFQYFILGGILYDIIPLINSKIPLNSDRHVCLLPIVAAVFV